MALWRNTSTWVKVLLIVVAILVIWAIVGRIPLSHGGVVGPPTPASISGP